MTDGIWRGLDPRNWGRIGSIGIFLLNVLLVLGVVYGSCWAGAPAEKRLGEITLVLLIIFSFVVVPFVYLLYQFLEARLFRTGSSQPAPTPRSRTSEARPS